MSTDEQAELKRAVKAWLKKNNISRDQFSARCGVAKGTFRNWMGKGYITKRKELLIRSILDEQRRDMEKRMLLRQYAHRIGLLMPTEHYNKLKDLADLDGITPDEALMKICIPFIDKMWRSIQRDKNPPAAASPSTHRI